MMMDPDGALSFLELDAEQMAGFAAERAHALGLALPATHTAAVIENLMTLQSHAKLVAQAVDAARAPSRQAKL
jgi:hypothetical protein